MNSKLKSITNIIFILFLVFTVCQPLANFENNVKAGSGVFGYNTIGGSGGQTNGYIIGISGFSPSSNGYADNITFYCYTGLLSVKITCALYNGTDKLVGQTGERSQTFSSWNWYVFDFSDPAPQVYSNESYKIVWWADGYVDYKYDTSTGHVYKSQGYTGTFPSTISWGSTSYTKKHSIYCCYSEESPDAEPTITLNSPENETFWYPLQPTCNVTVNDAYGDSMNVTFASDYSGSLVNYQTNSSVGNGSVIWYFNGATAYNKQYNWTVYCDDGTTNVSQTYYFVTLDPNAVNQTLSNYATRMPHERHTFYANGSYWIFYGLNYSGFNKVVYQTSTDGSTWSSKNDIRDCYYDGTFGSHGGAGFSVWLNETTDDIHYSYGQYGNLYYRKGHLNSNGIITWYYTEETVDTSECYHSVICLNSTGYPSIVYNQNDNKIYIRSSTTNDGNWTDSGETELFDQGGGGHWQQFPLIPLENEKLFVLWADGNENVSGRLYNGTGWESTEAVNTTINLSVNLFADDFSAIAVGDEVHVLFKDDSDEELWYFYRNNSGWNNGVNITDTLTSTYTYGVLSYDSENNRIYAIWEDDNKIYYRYCENTTGTWTWNDTITEWISNNSLYEGRLASSYDCYDGKLCINYMLDNYHDANCVMFESHDVSLGWSNTPPTQEMFRVNETGINGSANIIRWPKLQIRVNDSDGNESKVYWSANGSALYQTNLSVLNETVYDMNFSFADSYSTTYQVNISVNDTHDNVSTWYRFTTRADPNNPPSFTLMDPFDGETNWGITNCTLSLNISDAEGDTFGYEWACSDGSYNIAAGNTNGTKYLMLGGCPLDYATVYTWWVNATDEHGLYTNTTFTFTTENAPNNAPTFSNESPANNSVSVDLYTQLNVTVNDVDGNTTTVCFWYYDTDHWYKIQQNDTFTANTTARVMNFTNASSYSTSYTWMATAEDEFDNSSAIYSFTTGALAWFNTAPNISSPNPANGSTNINRYPDLSIYVGDADGNSSTVYWYWNDSGTPYLLQTDTNVLNETVTLSSFPNASSYSTTYYWQVSANDTIDNTTEWFKFTTKANTAPQQSGQLIYDSGTSTEWNLNATNVENDPTSINLTISDANADILEWFIYRNVSGVWVLVDSSSGLYNGSYYSINVSWISYSTNYTISFNVTDGTDWINRTFWFTTNNPHPVFGATYPNNGSSVLVDHVNWTIAITDYTGSFNWTIECNGQNNSGNGSSNGTKYLNLANLTFGTTYTVYVNATNIYNWTREWFTFSVVTPDTSHHHGSDEETEEADGNKTEERPPIELTNENIGISIMIIGIIMFFIILIAKIRDDKDKKRKLHA